MLSSTALTTKFPFFRVRDMELEVIAQKKEHDETKAILQVIYFSYKQLPENISRALCDN